VAMPRGVAGLEKEKAGRNQMAADDSDMEEVYNTERHLLYVACTRARDHLIVTSVDPASEFLDDLGIENEELDYLLNDFNHIFREKAAG
jgi:ATP-dependent exoDNAse (exonuclease V) beta subunit